MFNHLQLILLIGTPLLPEPMVECGVPLFVEALSQPQLVSVCHRCPSEPDLSEAFQQDILAETRQLLPDLICFFPDQFVETPFEALLDFCTQLQGLIQNKQKPVFIVQSHCSESQRISYFVHGVDDVLATTLSADELKIRLLVHLRRNFEAHLQDITLLPGLQFAHKITQRRLNGKYRIALLAIKISELSTYTQNYGVLATWQVLKTLTHILSTMVFLPDCIFQSDEQDLVILSHPDKAEKLANLICRQFEAAIPNFYAEPERKQGFMVADSSHHISRRVPLLHLSIGIASADQQPFDSFLSGYHLAQQMKRLAEAQPGSTWHASRKSLAGETVPLLQKQMLRILVLEPDEALTYLLKTTLTMEGYQVDAVSTTQSALDVLSSSSQSVPVGLVIMDALLSGEEEASSLLACPETGLTFAAQLVKQYPALQIICTSSLHNRYHVMQSGITLYLPKPYELSLLFYWIRKLCP